MGFNADVPCFNPRSVRWLDLSLAPVRIQLHLALKITALSPSANWASFKEPN